jgi:SAM-dependent methyltransferase
MTSVDAGNADMAAAWDGNEGNHWAANAARYDSVIRPYSLRLRKAAGITAGQNVLDIGSGNGETTLDAARSAGPESKVVGLDLSGPMIEVARSRAAAERLDQVRFVQGDAQVYPFDPAGFDTAISRFGVMFFADPVAAFTNVGRALRSGGRLAFVAWQPPARNQWVTALRAALAAGRDLPSPPPGAPGPFGLADGDRVRHILDASGFTAIELATLTEPFVAGSDADDAYGFFSSLGITRSLLEDLDDAGRQAALDRLRATVEAHATAEGIVFESAAWLVTAQR